MAGIAKTLRERAQTVLHDLLRGRGAPRAPDAWSPRFDLVEASEEYRFSADLPDIAAEDLHVTAVGRCLQIAGRRDVDRKVDALRVRELRRGYFARWFTLPDDADLDHATGELDGGHLTVVIPRVSSATTR